VNSRRKEEYVSNMKVTCLCFAGSPNQLMVISASAKALWNTVAGGNSSYAVLGPEGVGTFGGMRAPAILFDGSLQTRFTSYGNSPNGSNAIAGLNTGFSVIAGICPSILNGFVMATCTNNTNRSPLTLTIEGSNYTDNLDMGSRWTLIYNGSSGLDNTDIAATDGLYQMVNANGTYRSYRFLITAKRGKKSNVVCYSEVKLYGVYDSSTPPSMNGNSPKYYERKKKKIFFFFETRRTCPIAY